MSHMVIIPTTDIVPFLNQFADTGDWETWRVMADYFADAGDDVGEQWARWVWRERKRPHYDNKYGFRDPYCFAKLGHVYMLAFEDVFKEEHRVPLCLYDAYNKLAINRTEPIDTLPDAYAVLLDAFRLLSDEEREEVTTT